MPQRPLVGAYTDSRATATIAGNIRFLHLPPVDPPNPDQFQSSVAFISILVEKHKPHVRHLLINSGNSVRVAGFFIDMFCTSMIDVADELGIPCYLFFASPAAFLGFMLHLPASNTQLSELTPEFDESETELAIPSFSNPVPRKVLPTFFLKRNGDDGYTWFLRHARRYRETKGIVVNTFQELEPFALKSFSSSDIPPVHPVGPLLDHVGPAKWLSDRSQREMIMTWLDQQPASSVVFLCFGSMGSLSEAQLREIALGLERTGFRILWSLREPARGKLDLPSDYSDVQDVLPDGFLERTAGMGLVCGWAPQVAILAHRATGGFVSHCGWKSVLESLWHGVPVATWPVYAEQQMNAFELVRELGLAAEIRLDYRQGSDLVLAEEIERGVRGLMEGDGEVRERVKEMSEKSRMALMADGSSTVCLEHLIEELMAEI
ncbi:hypothetical protein RJ640_019362 [Escallonia rubra]|uniref:Glycosyltransferase n=1 Tax=Escallonia rubra TaxID=112253 RepID=A0AA88RHA6_9ASTE|nr:hypothetical protein RJ640_019362 [Escallonia rubra]